MAEIKRALLSVSDKTGLPEFAKGLSELGVELFASGGTAKLLSESGIDVQDIAEYTGQGEMLGGRVKTLQPRLHAGILARREDPAHMQELAENEIVPIDLVVVNLYPFEVKVDKKTPHQEAMEWVDIGGEALIRAAAKNFISVGIIVDPSDYDLVLSELRDHTELSTEVSLMLARKGFQHVARYNSVISGWFASREAHPEMFSAVEPEQLSLRYGENPHQTSSLYDAQLRINQLQGKELSFVNVLDAEAVLKCVSEFEEPTAVIVKHTSPCGVASADDLSTAFQQANEADSKSAFGGIIGLNRDVDKATAELISQSFFEVVVAPDFSNEAREILSEKKNLRLIEAPKERFDAKIEFRSTAFGILTQTPSSDVVSTKDLEVVSTRKPSDQEMADAVFAWKVAKYVKSNAIVIAKDSRTLGIGGGQVSRVDASEKAVEKAGELARGAVLASDAFIPFRDNVDAAAAAGVKVIVQTGGAMRDEEVLEAAEEHDISMIYTRIREFKH